MGQKLRALAIFFHCWVKTENTLYTVLLYLLSYKKMPPFIIIIIVFFFMIIVFDLYKCFTKRNLTFIL